MYPTSRPLAHGLIAESTLPHPPTRGSQLPPRLKSQFRLPVFLSPQPPYIALLGARPWHSLSVSPCPCHSIELKQSCLTPHARYPRPVTARSTRPPIRLTLPRVPRPARPRPPCPRCRKLSRVGPDHCFFLPSCMGLTSPAACFFSFAYHPLVS